MQLRSKLLISFSVMILLAGIITYTGYSALQEVENARKLILSSSEAEIALLEGNVSGMHFVLNGDKKDLEISTKAYEAAIKHLLAIGKLTQDARVEKAEKALTLHIQNIEKSSQEIGEMHDVLNADLENFANVGKTLVNAVKDTSSTFRAIGMDNVILALTTEFYEIRLIVQRFVRQPSVELQQELKKLLTQFINDSKKYESRISDPTANRQFKKLTALLLKYEQTGFEYSQAALAFKDMIPEIGGMLAKAREDIEALSKIVLANQRKNLNRSEMILMLISGVVVLFGIGITLLLTRSVLAQLGRDPGVLVNVTKKVIDGDFNIEDKGKKIGVYGSLVDMVKNLEDNIHKAEHQTEMAKVESEKAMQAMKQAEEAQKAAERAKRDGMLHAAEQLEGIVAVVSSAAEQLSAQIEQSSRGAEQQSERVSETATAMEEMNGAVLEVARNSGQASDLSVQAKEKAQAGAKIVEEAGSHMTVLQEQSNVLKEDMSELDQHATAISEIMSVISDIADQTNLLALNAAIEAARAGEYGRGFAVVADEVRKLAEKTMHSTADVSNAITQIQESAAKNIRSVDRTGAIIGEVMEKAQAASASLTEIVSLVDESSDQVRAIATASEEQSATSEEINRSVSEVNTISSETSQAMQEASQAVMELSNQAHELSKLIQDMKNS